MYQSFLSSFYAEVHTAKSSHFHNMINSSPDMCNLFRTFNSLLCPPSPPPTTSITADDFATFFTDKTRTISSQFSPPLTQDLQPTTSTAQPPIFSFCPLTEAEVSKLLLSSHPTTCPLDPIPSHLLQAISPTLLPALTHIINTFLLTDIFPTAFKQARVTPLLKKLLVQALVISRLDYCDALLAGLPSNTINPLQMIQNAAARLVFKKPKRAHVTPLFVSLHWLMVAACIQFKTLMLAYRTTTGSAPSYFHSLLQIYIPSRSLRSASERRLVVPSQRGSKSLSRTFSFTIPGRWNDLPTPIRTAGSLSIFKQQLKTHLFQHYLTSS